MRSAGSCALRRVYSLILGSLASSSALGARAGGGASQSGSSEVGVGVGLGVGVGNGVGAGPPKKEKSVVIDEDSHGTCSPCVALTTPIWVFRNAWSAVVPGARISRSNSVTNRP